MSGASRRRDRLRSAAGGSGRLPAAAGGCAAVAYASVVLAPPPPPTRAGIVRGLAVAVVTGLALALAFPPFGLWWLAPVCVAATTLLAASTTPWRSLGLGMACGLAFFGLHLKWMLVVGLDAWLLLAALQAAFVALLFAGTTLVRRLPGWPLWTACLWVSQEIARSSIPFGGFPWGRLAFAQADAPYRGLAALGGMPLLSFAVALSGTLLAAALTRRTTGDPDSAAAGAAAAAPDSRWTGANTQRALAAAGALAVPLLALAVPTPTGGPTVVAAVIQGNVPRTGLDAFGQRAAVLDNHVSATTTLAAAIATGAQPAPALVVWPEDSTDIDPFADPAAAQAIQGAVDAVGAPTLVGAVIANPADSHTVLNTGIVWAPASAPGGGGPGQRYVKRHPVPFGEYVPFRAELTGWVSELSRIPEDFAAGTRPGLLQLGPVKIGDVICFEIAYDSIVHDVAADAQLLVVQTNNATYGRTGQPDQQLAISRLRAIETGRTVLVAATSGFSAVIAPDGRMVAHSKEFERWVYDGPVTVRTTPTLATRVGAWPAGILGTLGVGAVALASVRRRRERNPSDDARTLQPS
jgi:apolipoprotein N-acyltransferase